MMGCMTNITYRLSTGSYHQLDTYLYTSLRMKGNPIKGSIGAFSTPDQGKVAPCVLGKLKENDGQ